LRLHQGAERAEHVHLLYGDGALHLSERHFLLQNRGGCRGEMRRVDDRRWMHHVRRKDTGLLAGTAIRVSFNATNYKDGQCPLFWGPTCKALQTCCAQLSSGQSTSCNDQLLTALGKEATCQMVSNQFCMGDAGNGTDGSSDAGTGRADASTDRDPSLPPGFPPPPPPSF
jgi:hypothetical protein